MYGMAVTVAILQWQYMHMARLLEQVMAVRGAIYIYKKFFYILARPCRVTIFVTWLILDRVAILQEQYIYVTRLLEQSTAIRGAIYIQDFFLYSHGRQSDNIRGTAVRVVILQQQYVCLGTAVRLGHSHQSRDNIRNFDQTEFTSSQLLHYQITVIRPEGDYLVRLL